ncbi:MAG: GAF domain-containing protein, partial [Actinomycetota bacterium]
DPLAGDPYADDPYGTTWYEDPSSGDPVTTLPPGDTGFPSPTTVPAAPPDVLALVDQVEVDGDRGDALEPSELPIDEATVAGAARLVLGIDALAELGAFRRDPDPMVNDAVRSVRERIPADGLNADGYRSEIRVLRDDVADLVEMLDATGPVGIPLLEVEAALNDPALLDRLDAGETALFEPHDWLAASADLLLRAGQEPALDDSEAGADDLPAVLALADRLAGPETPAAAAGSTTSTTTPSTTTQPALDEAEASDADAEAGSGRSWLLPVAAAGALLVLVGLAMAARGRRSRTDAARPADLAASGSPADTSASAATALGGDGPTGAETKQAAQASLEDLLDVSRRMTASLDATEVAAIALAEAERLVDGEGGLLATWNGTDFGVLCHRPAPLFDLDALGDGSLKRVVDTGRSIVQVTDDEPALVEVPMAMAAIPVVADGRVVGAILVVRVSSNPFARNDLDGLEMLAPLIGSALVAAETHGSATELADLD